MTHTMIYLLAELHRAMHQGHKVLEVSCLDLSEVLAALESLEGQQKAKFCGQEVGWINGEKLTKLRRGERFYLTIRRQKNPDYNVQVFTAPRQKPLDAVAESIQDDA